MITTVQTNMVNNKVEYDKYKLNETSYLERAAIPSFSWIGNLGNFIFDEIELYFNDLLIDKQYSTWINIWHELNNTYDKKELLEKMIGNTKYRINNEFDLKVFNKSLCIYSNCTKEEMSVK